MAQPARGDPRGRGGAGRAAVTHYISLPILARQCRITYAIHTWQGVIRCPVDFLARIGRGSTDNRNIGNRDKMATFTTSCREAAYSAHTPPAQSKKRDHLKMAGVNLPYCDGRNHAWQGANCLCSVSCRKHRILTIRWTDTASIAHRGCVFALVYGALFCAPKNCPRAVLPAPLYGGVHFARIGSNFPGL